MKSEWGLGSRRGGRACKHLFKFFIPAYQLLVYPLIGQFLSPSVLKYSQTYKPSDSSKRCVCSTLISRKNDPFAMIPTGFGKSINFQLLPRVAKALQCCDTTSLHTAYNIASPGTIYSSHLTQLLCPMHATIVSIQRYSLKTLTNEKNTIFCYSFLCKYLAAYSNSLARVS